MKLLFKSFISAMIILMIFAMVPFSAQCENISNNVFRLHILANSNSEYDQNLKLKVRDSILEYTKSIYQTSQNCIDAEKLTSSMLQDIANIAQKTVYENGYNYKVTAEICNMYFNTRVYEDVTMPSGNYNALRLTIGEGKGDNWWCVMYPSLCVGTATDYNSLKENTSADEYSILIDDKPLYKFKIVEYFEKICSFFY